MTCLSDMVRLQAEMESTRIWESHSHAYSIIDDMVSISFTILSMDPSMTRFRLPDVILYNK